MNAPLPADKFRAYRARKRAAGLRQVRLWVPDVNAIEFQVALDTQIDRINAVEDERDVLRFTVAATTDLWMGLD